MAVGPGFENHARADGFFAVGRDGLPGRRVDRPPAIMMPYNPAYYPEFFETYGLEKRKILCLLDGCP